jgi:hypothetical protein
VFDSPNMYDDGSFFRYVTAREIAQIAEDHLIAEEEIAALLAGNDKADRDYSECDVDKARSIYDGLPDGNNKQVIKAAAQKLIQAAKKDKNYQGYNLDDALAVILDYLGLLFAPDAERDEILSHSHISIDKPIG